MLNIFSAKHGTTNYKNLYPFIEAVDCAGGHAVFKADGYMNLSIENLERCEWFLGKPMNVYSISHYGTQNGDLMADPDIEFGVIDDGKHMRVIPMTFQNDYLGVYQRVFNDDRTMYNHVLLTDLDGFLYQWLKNIKEQGFYDDIPNIEKQLDYEEEIIF